MGYYDESAEGYNELHGEEQQYKLDIVKNEIKIEKSDKLLDVGCGTGISSNFDCDVVGIDPSQGLLEHNTTKKKVNAFAEQLPFKDHSFDVVVSLTAIHNFSDIELGILEMKRVGKKQFVFGILKRAQQFDQIEKIIRDNFKIGKKVDAGRDWIFFCRK